MVYHRRGNDWGAFAKGFSEAFAAMLKLGEDKRHNEALEAHWARLDQLATQNNPYANGVFGAGKGGFREGAGGSSYGGDGGGGVAANAGAMKDFYVSQGYTPEGASAIVGNWQQENSLRGGGWGGDNGTSAGGFQWHDDPAKGLHRGTDFMAWVAQNKLDVNDPMTSAKYSIVDIKNNYPALDKYLRTTNNVDEATQKFETDFEGASKPAMGNRLAAAHAVYALKGGDKTEPTVDGKPAVTTIVEGKPNETPVKAEKAADKTSQADLPPANQVAGGTDEEAMRIALEENQKLKEQQDRDSSAPPPGGGAPMPRRSLPINMQTQPRPAPPRPEQVSAIPQGPTVAAQDTPFAPPPESGYPESAQTLPHEPPMTTQLGPESLYAPPDVRGATLEPQDQPSSGVGVSVHDSRQGPPQRTGAPPTVGPTPSSAPPPRQGPPQRTGAPPNVGITPSAIPQRPIMGPPQRTGAPPTVGATPSMPPVQGPDQSEEVTSPGRTGPAEINVKLAGGQRDERTTPDADKPAPGAIPTSATAPAPTPQSKQGGGGGARFVAIDRPNAGPNERNRGSPQGTALDLSSLWGPNPPVSQRGQATAAPPSAAVAAPSRRPDDDYGGAYSDVASMPPQSDYEAGVAMGQAKGGAVRRYAQGGAIPARPVRRYDAGGPAANTGMGGNNDAGGGYNAGAYGSAAPAYYSGQVPYSTWNSPTSTTYTPLANQPEMGVFAKSLAVPSPNQAQLGYLPWSNIIGGQGPAAKSNYASMTPDQQAWYNQQRANATATGNQWYYNPASFPTTPAAAAPAAAPPAAAPPPVVDPATTTTVKDVPDTTVVDPTTVAGAGAPGLPKNITAKSYDPNVDAKTGAGFANTQNAGGTNYTVDAKDTQKTDDAGNTISGYAGGGAIPSQPTMKFADSGVVPYTTIGYQGARTPGQQYFFSPEYAGPGLAGNTWRGADRSTLAPNQQAWADTQQNLVNQINAAAKQMGPQGGPDTSQYFSQMTVMPTAIWPTAAPAAPAVVNQPPPTTTATTPPAAAPDPNNQPGSGAPGLPNSLAPAGDTPAGDTPAAPIVDPSIDTITNTPTNPVPKQAKTYDPTQGTTGKYSSGSKDQGDTNYQRSIDPNSASSFGQYNYGQIQGFDDGGAVGPSSLGMPPGLAGGQQPVPPIYYSGATYSPAGAPVGKGVTQNSLPTQIGMAIPTLPMLRGGMVRRYADGGEVDEYSGRPNEDVSEGGRSGTGYDDYTGDYGGAGAPTAPVDTYAMASSPQEAHPDLPAWTPQVTDGQGNPSRGLTGAIAGGLHYLASQLGLGGGEPQGAVARDPATQANRRTFAQGDGVPGAPMPSHAEVSQIHQSLGLNDGLHEGLSNLAGMEAVRNFYLVHGDPDKADRMAASMLQYSVGLSRDYGDQAVKRYYANDLNGAVHAMVRAKEAIADGTLMNAQVSADGQSVNIEGTDLNGKQLWAKTVAPEAILGAALHTADGSLAWHMYEIQAAKYDPVSQQMAAERRQNRTWEHQQDVLGQREDFRQRQIDAKEAAKEAAAEKQAGLEAAVLKGVNQPRAPAIIPVGAPPALPGPGSAPAAPAAPAAPVQATAAPAVTQPPPGSVPDSTGTAATAAPPPLADARGPTGHGGALPGPPTSPADLSSPDAQPVSELAPEPLPPRPDEFPEYTQMDAAHQAASWRTYNAQVNDIHNRTAAQYKQAHDDRQAGLTRQSQENIAKRQQISIAAQEAAAAKRQTDQQTFETTKEQSARKYAMAKPRDQQDVARAFNTAPNESGVPGKEPTTYMAEAMGFLKSDGTMDKDQLDKSFTRDEQPVIAQAIVQGYHFSPDQDAPLIAKAIMGSLTDPNYIMHKTPIPPDEEYGVPRYAITVEHRGTGTSTSFVLPVEAYNNLKALYANKQMAATTGAAREAFAAPPVPTPNAGGFPGAGNAPTPQSGFNAPPRPITPNQKWWIDQALGKGQGIPMVPTRSPDEQGGRGYIR